MERQCVDWRFDGLLCCCRLLDCQRRRDRCVSGKHVVGRHTHRTLRTSRVTLASTVSSLTDPLRTRRATRQWSSWSDATRRAISPTSSSHKRVALPARSHQGIPVHRQDVSDFWRSRAATLSRQDEGSDSSEDRRRTAAPPTRLLPAVQWSVVPHCRRRLRLAVMLLAACPSPASRQDIIRPVVRRLLIN